MRGDERRRRRTDTTETNTETRSAVGLPVPGRLPCYSVGRRPTSAVVPSSPVERATSGRRFRHRPRVSVGELVFGSPVGGLSGLKMVVRSPAYVVLPWSLRS